MTVFKQKEAASLLAERLNIINWSKNQSYSITWRTV